jgi:uncharacterized protein YeaO (DUF488 family)
MLSIKRAYEPAKKNDGLRILVDRVWPRGLTKTKLQLHEWRKEIAPSTPLRKWFNHDPNRWVEFKRRYRAELKDHRSELSELRALASRKHVTLVYSAKDETHNQAVALKEFLEK